MLIKTQAQALLRLIVKMSSRLCSAPGMISERRACILWGGGCHLQTRPVWCCNKTNGWILMSATMHLSEGLLLEGPSVGEYPRQTASSDRSMSSPKVTPSYGSSSYTTTSGPSCHRTQATLSPRSGRLRTRCRRQDKPLLTGRYGRACAIWGRKNAIITIPGWALI